MNFKSLIRLDKISIVCITALLAAWLSGMLALLVLVAYSEGFTGAILTGVLAPLSIFVAIAALLGAVLGSIGGVLAFNRSNFTFVIVSLDLEFFGGVLSVLNSQGFFLSLGLPIIILSVVSLMLAFDQKYEFGATRISAAES